MLQPLRLFSAGSTGGGRFGVTGKSLPPKDQASRDEADHAGTQEPALLTLLEQAERLAEKRRQLRFLQEFFQGPLMADMREAPLTTSSPAEEVEQRRADLRYRIKVLGALLTLFEEEIAMLERLETPVDAASPQE
jgi:hypothetical protein